MLRPHAAIISAILLTSACSMSGSNSVEIKNNAKLGLVNVQVEVGGKRIQIGSIDPGSVGKADFIPESDSSVRVTYNLGKTPRACVGDVYVTTGWNQHYSVTIEENEPCRVKKLD